MCARGLAERFPIIAVAPRLSPRCQRARCGSGADVRTAVTVVCRFYPGRPFCVNELVMVYYNRLNVVNPCAMEPNRGAPFRFRKRNRTFRSMVHLYRIYKIFIPLFPRRRIRVGRPRARGGPAAGAAPSRAPGRTVYARRDRGPDDSCQPRPSTTIFRRLRDGGTALGQFFVTRIKTVDLRSLEVDLGRHDISINPIDLMCERHKLARLRSN
jgi:hypothetical protein